MCKPELRFKEFSDDWKNNKLGEIAKFSKGKGISKNDISVEGTECIRYGELYTTYNEKISVVFSKTNLNKKNLVLSGKHDILIPSSGETAIDLATASCLMKEGIAIGGDTNILKTDENSLFLSYYLNYKRNEIAILAQGVSVVHLYAQHLKILDLNLPSFNEQEEIADFLSIVDEKIAILEKKLEKWDLYKKGIMQQLFSQELRFKDENGDNYPEWELKILEELMAKGKAGGTPKSTEPTFYNGNIPFLSIADMTSQGKYIFRTEKNITNLGLENSSAWIIPKNNLLYSIYASIGFVAINKVELTTSQAIFGLMLKKDFNLEFIYYMLLDFKKHIPRYTETGTQGNLNSKIVKNFEFEIPSIEEQRKIATFLVNMDEKIGKIEEKIDKVQKFKKGLLQKMFC